MKSAHTDQGVVWCGVVGFVVVGWGVVWCGGVCCGGVGWGVIWCSLVWCGVCYEA